MRLENSLSMVSPTVHLAQRAGEMRHFSLLSHPLFAYPLIPFPTFSSLVLSSPLPYPVTLSLRVYESKDCLSPKRKLRFLNLQSDTKPIPLSSRVRSEHMTNTWLTGDTRQRYHVIELTDYQATCTAARPRTDLNALNLKLISFSALP